MASTFQSPSRPIPGMYMATPAARRYQSAPGGQQSSHPASQQLSQPNRAAGQGSTVNQDGLKSRVPDLSSVERAARTINEVLAQEQRYPDLDTYLGREFIVAVI